MLFSEPLVCFLYCYGMIRHVSFPKTIAAGAGAGRKGLRSRRVSSSKNAPKVLLVRSFWEGGM